MNESAFERDLRVDTQCPGEWDRDKSVELHLLLRIAEKLEEEEKRCGCGGWALPETDPPICKDCI